MASGSHSGEVFQALPTHMGLWDAYGLGWADPLTLAPGADAAKDNSYATVHVTSATPQFDGRLPDG